MVDLIEAITKGIDLHSFFYSKFYGAIKFRPLTNHEIQQVMDASFAGKNMEVIKFIKSMKFFIGNNLDVEPTRELLDECGEIWNEIDTWIVYHGVKDFQKDEWQQAFDGRPVGYWMLKHPKCCLEIEQLANEINSLSVIPQEEIASFLVTDDGEVLGKALWKLRYPLTDKMWKLTNIQLEFIIESGKYKSKKKFKDTKDLLSHLGMKPIVPVSKEESDLIQKLEKIKSELGRNKY